MRTNSDRSRDRPGATRSILDAISSSISISTCFIYYSILKSINVSTRIDCWKSFCGDSDRAIKQEWKTGLEGMNRAIAGAAASTRTVVIGGMPGLQALADNHTRMRNGVGFEGPKVKLLMQSRRSPSAGLARSFWISPGPNSAPAARFRRSSWWRQSSSLGSCLRCVLRPAETYGSGRSIQRNRRR